MKTLVLSLIAVFAAVSTLHAHCGTCSLSEMESGADAHHAEGHSDCYDGKLTSYFSIQKALAKDDLTTAKVAAEDLGKHIAASTCAIDEADCCAETAASAEAIAKAKDIAAARTAFKVFSDALIAELDSHGSEVAAYKMHCPMASKGKGASWLQDNKELRNPYFGASMLTCGTQQASYGEKH